MCGGDGVAFEVGEVEVAEGDAAGAADVHVVVAHCGMVSGGYGREWEWGL